MTIQDFANNANNNLIAELWNLSAKLDREAGDFEDENGFANEPLEREVESVNHELTALLSVDIRLAQDSNWKVLYVKPERDMYRVYCEAPEAVASIAVRETFLLNASDEVIFNA